MHKTFTIQNMQSYFRNYLPCSEHSHEPITNFCTQRMCLKFMCPECVQKHSHTHANHPIESIKTCIKKTSYKLNKAIEQLENEKNMHRIMRYKDPQQYELELINELQEVRKSLINEINQYFSNKVSEIKKQTSKSHGITSKIKSIQNQLNKVISQLTLLNKNLLVSNQSVHAIEKSNKIDYPLLIQHFRKKIQEVENDMSFDIKVETNPNKRKDFKIALNNLIGIRNRNQYDNFPTNQTKLGSSIINRKPAIDPYRQKTEQQVKYYNQKVQYIVNPPPLSADRMLTQAGFRIDMQNYFQMNPFLHFFEVSKSNLHILKLKKIKETQPLKWQVIPLNIDFTIPSFHRTVASENGNIYLIGGTIPQSLEKSDKIYQYDAMNNNLKLVNNLNIGRSSHSIVCHKKIIYIVGGMVDQQIPKKCQLFNCRTNQVKLIAPCKYPTTNSTLSVLGNDNLIKLGGVDIQGRNSNYIEIYNILADFWGQVDPTVENIKGEFGLLSCSGWASLNEDQIFIFGGYNEQADNQNSKMSFVFEYNKQEKQFYIKYINTKNIPLAEGFWSPQSVICDGNIYALQNVDGEEQCDCLEDKRNVLIFNGKFWTVCYSD